MADVSFASGLRSILGAGSSIFRKFPISAPSMLHVGARAQNPPQDSPLQSYLHEWQIAQIRSSTQRDDGEPRKGIPGSPTSSATGDDLHR